MKKVFILLAFLFGMTLAQEKVKMLLNWFPEPGHGGYYAALQDGLFAAKGLDVTLQAGGPDINGRAFLLTGRTQFTMLGATQLLLAREQGEPIVAIFALYQNNPLGLMYHAENPVGSFEDLAGRKVAIAPGTPFWDFIERKYDLAGKVQVINYDGGLANWARDPLAVTQAYVTAEPYSAEKEGFPNGTLLVSESGYNPYGDIVVTTEDFLAEQPETVKAFVEALQGGYKAFFAEPGNYVNTLQEANSENTEDFVLWSAEAVEGFANTGDATTRGLGIMTLERWQTAYDQLKDIGVLRKETTLDLTKLFDASFIASP
jgi:NitT/TauT family transport system substrate-binding protein